MAHGILTGTDIPVTARIIAVADSYDAMTSKRSYRAPIPQSKVREEIFKGMGTQFDPQYARIMLHLIDLDLEYQMQEHESVKELAGKDSLVCEGYRSACSEGILLSDHTLRMRFRCQIGESSSAGDDQAFAAILVFDSLDGRVHDDAGIAIKCVTTLSSPAPEVYVALTGDQCTITDIRIR